MKETIEIPSIISTTLKYDLKKSGQLLQTEFTLNKNVK